MSGEFISTHVYLQDKDIFNKGAGNFSSKSINELLDVNDDGVIDGVERDRMESVGLINTLDSISPLVARSYSDHLFKLNTGGYLTESQRASRDAMSKLVSDFLNADDDIPIERRHDIMPFEIMQTLDGDLNADLKNRRYLEDSELNNDP
jgi:hypothetical protein